MDAPVHGEGVEGELQLILPFAKARHVGPATLRTAGRVRWGAAWEA